MPIAQEMLVIQALQEAQGMLVALVTQETPTIRVLQAIQEPLEHKLATKI